MENTNTPNPDFEKYLKNNLQKVNKSPDDELWGRIIHEQSRTNMRLKLKQYAWYALGVLVTLAIVSGLWYDKLFDKNQKTGPEQEIQQPIQERKSEMVDVLGINAENDEPQTTRKSADIPASAPNFSTRINSVPGNTQSFQAEEGISYENPITGTTVKIPANSLMDTEGNAVYGEAELYFREYRSVADYLASGIPMHYTDDRGQYFFNSGGMFEVRVSQRGTPLSIKTGSDYTVNFSPTQNLKDASLYFLDDQSKAWEFIPEAAFGQQNLTKPPVASAMEVALNNIAKRGASCLPDLVTPVDNPNPAAFIKLGVQTGYDLATGKIIMPTWFKKNPFLTDNQLLFRLERGLIQIKWHKDQGRLFFPEDLNHYFTELTALKDCYFTFNADSMGGATNTKYASKNDYWQRIIISHEGGKDCFITLFDGKENQMQFHSVLKGSTENENFDPEAVMAEYNRLRNKRLQDFGAKNKALRSFLFAASIFKPEGEWCLSPQDWLEYFEQNHPMMADRYDKLITEGLAQNDELATKAWDDWQAKLLGLRFARNQDGSMNKELASSSLRYSLRLSKFGTYNCDQIFRFGNGKNQYVLATYKTPEGVTINPFSVCLLERSSRIFITQPNVDKLFSAEGRRLDVIITDLNGRQYHYPAEKYASQPFDKNKSTVLTLDDVTERTNSPRAWMELLEI